MADQLSQILEQIKSTIKLSFTGTSGRDPDAIGSQVGLGEILKAFSRFTW